MLFWISLKHRVVDVCEVVIETERIDVARNELGFNVDHMLTPDIVILQRISFANHIGDISVNICQIVYNIHLLIDCLLHFESPFRGNNSHDFDLGILQTYNIEIRETVIET